MTALIGRKTDKEPILCAVCGRRAGPFGHMPKVGRDIAWLCENPACIPLAKDVYIMDGRKLDVYEKTAIGEAGRSITEQLAETFLGALWQEGVRDLGQVDAAKLQAVARAAHQTPEFNRAMTAFLAEFGKSIREQIVGGQPPF